MSSATEDQSHSECCYGTVVLAGTQHRGGSGIPDWGRGGGEVQATSDAVAFQ